MISELLTYVELDKVVNVELTWLKNPRSVASLLTTALITLRFEALIG